MAEEKVEIPKGITPIWLSGTTISMFNLQEMNEENPIKRVSCKDILADIQFRGKTSDWEPAKATFVDYVDGDKPKEELEVLLVFDEDNVYGDNFYLCKNEETAAEIIEKFTKKDETATEGEAAAEAQEEEEPRPREIVDPDPINRPWQEWEPSEGVTGVKTAESIDALVIRDCDPPLLKYSMSRQRRYFGLGGRFHDVDHVESEDFKPYRDPQFKENTADKELAGPGISIFGTRFMERESASQCVPSTEEAATQVNAPFQAERRALSSREPRLFKQRAAPFQAESRAFSSRETRPFKQRAAPFQAESRGAVGGDACCSQRV